MFGFVAKVMVVVTGLFAAGTGQRPHLGQLALANRHDDGVVGLVGKGALDLGVGGLTVGTTLIGLEPLPGPLEKTTVGPVSLDLGFVGGRDFFVRALVSPTTLSAFIGLRVSTDALTNLLPVLFGHGGSASFGGVRTASLAPWFEAIALGSVLPKESHWLVAQTGAASLGQYTDFSHDLALSTRVFLGQSRVGLSGSSRLDSL
jgi:hypothetical protein